MFYYSDSDYFLFIISDDHVLLIFFYILKKLFVYLFYVTLLYVENTGFVLTVCCPQVTSPSEVVLGKYIIDAGEFRFLQD